MSLKYKARIKKWENYNRANIVDLENMRATSYDWWPYLKKINGKIVFNNYGYSSQTSKHQNQCLRLIEQNNINIDLMIYSRCHLDNLEGILSDYRERIIQLIKLIKKPRTRKTTNEVRKHNIRILRKDMIKIKQLIKKDVSHV